MSDRGSYRTAVPVIRDPRSDPQRLCMLRGMTGRRLTTEDDITDEVLRRVEATPDPRLRAIMSSLIRHLHAFVKDVQLSESEWFTAIDFLTRTGQLCTDKRQEFILLSDTLGVSMV